uniref:Uncharacterized protein n=1 Tax=Romanomermis culicivorax TaxID=13658 RepID=A0A915IKK8_ROMCU
MDSRERSVKASCLKLVAWAPEGTTIALDIYSTPPFHYNCSKRFVCRDYLEVRSASDLSMEGISETNFTFESQTIIQPRIPIPLDHDNESQPPEIDQSSSDVDSDATPTNSSPLSQFTHEPIASPPGFLPPLVDQSSPPPGNTDLSVRRSFVDFTATSAIATETARIGSGFELATSSPAFPTPPDWTAFKAASSAEEEQNVTSSSGASEEEEGGASSSSVPPANETSTTESVGEGGGAFSGSSATASEESGESESPSSASESESTSLIPGGHVFHNISDENGAAATSSIATESLTTITQSANETSAVAVSTTGETEGGNGTTFAPGLVVITSASATKETTESNGTEETGGVSLEGGVSTAELEGNETTLENNATATTTMASMFENQTTTEPEMVNATSGEGAGQENVTTTPGGKPVQGTAAWRLRLTDVAWDSSLNDKMSWQYRKLYDNVYPDLKDMFTDILKDNYAGTTIERFSAGSVIVSGKTESYDKVDNAQFGDSLDKQLKNRNTLCSVPGGSSPQVAPKTSTAGMPGYVIAIIVAAVAVLGAILIGAYFIRRRRNRQRENTYMIDEETMNGAAKSLQGVQPQQRPLGASRNGGGGGGSNRAEQVASINMYEMKDNPGAGAPGGQAAQTGQANTNFGYQDDGVPSNRAQNIKNGSSDKFRNFSKYAFSSEWFKSSSVVKVDYVLGMGKFYTSREGFKKST